METINVPAREGRAFRVRPGQHFRIVTPAGGQAADFFAFNSRNVGEWLSPNHTWTWSRAVRPRQGDVLLSRFRRPMLDFVTDEADGVHDMMVAACDQLRYEQLGFQGPHANCSDNLRYAMYRMGIEVDVVPQPINFFTHTRIEPDGALAAPPNPVPPGASVELRARFDLICVVSACPFDLDLSNWKINAESGPSALVVELAPGAQERGAGARPGSDGAA